MRSVSRAIVNLTMPVARFDEVAKMAENVGAFQNSFDLSEGRSTEPPIA